MARYVASVATPLSIAEAFAYMADVTHFAAWDPGVKRAVRVGGPDVGIGASYDLTVQAGGTTVMRYDVTAYEPPHRIRLESRTALLSSDDVITLRATNSGCVVTYDATLMLDGLLSLLDPLLGIAFRRIGDRAARGLASALQGNRLVG